MSVNGHRGLSFPFSRSPPNAVVRPLARYHNDRVDYDGAEETLLYLLPQGLDMEAILYTERYRILKIDLIYRDKRIVT
ncbi:hypothetical protein CHS0354_023397 [Potamilus streckersoni]|uniref:Uncharacterized protein n=1 Tax=Potamilus streckersoni TaxID=2493646 RepID=A0AAE0TAX0_9BIVA|nr:hypothetical protein CHS0354_023397 [Potamilus streckersoni]